MWCGVVWCGVVNKSISHVVVLQAKREEETLIRDLQESVDALSAKLGGVKFEYSDPTDDFDRSRVKGLVSRLIKLKDVHAATALEVTAGGKLYNVSCLLLLSLRVSTNQQLGCSRY